MTNLKKSEMTNDIKKKLKRETGIVLNYRSMGYLPNDNGNTPTYPQADGLKVAIFLNAYMNKYIKKNRAQYPDFDGFKFLIPVELKKLKACSLKQYVDGYITELYRLKSGKQNGRPVMANDTKLNRRQITLLDSDADAAKKIGNGNISAGIRTALRGHNP